MTIKEAFEQYRYFDIDIEAKKREFDNLRRSYNSAACVSKSDAENSIICEIYDLIHSKSEVEKAIEDVENPILKRLLVLKYKNGLTHEQAAEKLDKSERHLRRLQKKFFEEISKCP